MYESLIQPIEAIAATLIEGIVELFGDDGSKLRRPRENKGVKLPEDLFAHPEVQTECGTIPDIAKRNQGRGLASNSFFSSAGRTSTASASFHFVF